MDCQVSSEHIGEFKGSAAVHVVEVWGVHPDCDADYSRATPDIDCARDAMFDGSQASKPLSGLLMACFFGLC